MEKFILSEHDRATLQFKVTARLRELILKGHFESGERLMQEEWASKLGVSRMPIREALRQLEVEGLVMIEPRKGAIVTPISTEDIEEIYQLRALLEGQAVELAVNFLDEEDFDELEMLYEQMIALNHTEKELEVYTTMNKRFHTVLTEACPWRRTKSFIETLWQGIPSYTPSLLPEHFQESQAEHKLMVKYAKERNGEKLRKVTEKHILRTKENLVKMMLEK